MIRRVRMRDWERRGVSEGYKSPLADLTFTLSVYHIEGLRYFLAEEEVRRSAVSGVTRTIAL